MGNYFTQGLILQHHDFREADRIISIYTKDKGLVRVIAKGSRKIQSKLAGNLEPFTLAEFMIIKGKTYDTVASSEVINIFKNIKDDLVKIKLAFYFSNILLGTAKEMQRDNNLYDFILNIFLQIENLDSAKNKNKNWLVWFFIWQYLKLSGYQPQLYKCVRCKKSIIPDKIFFNYNKGGLICVGCSDEKVRLNLISINSIKIIRLILTSSFDDLVNIKISQNLAKEFIKHTRKYYSYVFENDIGIPFFKSI